MSLLSNCFICTFDTGLSAVALAVILCACNCLFAVGHAKVQAKIGRTTVPTYSTYLLAGPSPYVGFGWHEFGASQNVLADALYNFGTQVKINHSLLRSSVVGRFTLTINVFV